jgi:hypothetical protein
MLVPKAKSVRLSTTSEVVILEPTTATALVKSVVIANASGYATAVSLRCNYNSNAAFTYFLEDFPVPLAGRIVWDTPLVVQVGDDLAVTSIDGYALDVYLAWAEEG